MLTIYKNGNAFTFMYSYEANDDRLDVEPDVIVDDSLAALDSHADTFWSAMLAGELSRRSAGRGYRLVCRLRPLSHCGAQHDEGRFLTRDPAGFLESDGNLYRYVAKAPPVDEENNAP